MVFQRPLPRPIRIVLRWQAIVTVVITLVAAFLWGRDGALSAALGGAVNIVAGGGYGWGGFRGEARTAGGGVATMVRAEGIQGDRTPAGPLPVLTQYRDHVTRAFLR